MIVSTAERSLKIARPASEEFRRAALALSAAARAGHFRSIILASPSGREGTTSAAVHIGRHLRGGLGVNPLVIEINRLRPAFCRLFDLDPERSLATLLERGGVVADCVQRDATGLSLLPAGGSAASYWPAPNFESTLCHVVQELQNSFDLILLDAPPILESADVLVAGRVVPNLVLVVGAGQSSNEAINRACQQLRDGKIQIVGTILNSRKRIIPKWLDRWIRP